MPDTRRSYVAGVLLAALASGACAGGHPRRSSLAPAQPSEVLVTLVDSVAWEAGGNEGVLHRIQVRAGAAVDTIAGILTGAAPVTVRGNVLGYEYRGGDVVHAFRYDLAGRRLDRLPLPPDLNPYFSAPAISPTGEFVAYVVVPGNSTAAGVVRKWPDGAEVVRSAPVAVPATDVAAEHARWLDPVRFEIYIDLTGDTPRWHRIRGSVSTRALSADTVTKLP